MAFIDPAALGVTPDPSDETYPQQPATDPMGIIQDLARHAMADVPQENPVDARTVMNRLMRKAVQETDFNKPFPKPVIPESKIPPAGAPAPGQTSPTQQPSETDFSEFAKPGSKPAGGGADDFSEFAAPGSVKPPAQPGEPAPAEEPSLLPPEVGAPEGRPWWQKLAAGVARQIEQTGITGAKAARDASSYLGWGKGQEYFEDMAQKAEGKKPYSPEAEALMNKPGLFGSTSPRGRTQMTEEEQNSIPGMVGQGLGGIVALTPALMTGGWLGGAGLMGVLGAEETAEQARAAGASSDNVRNAAIAGGLTQAALGAIPLHMLLRPVERSPGLLNWAVAKLKQATTNGMVFATIGEAQHYLAQKIADEFYHVPEKEKTDEMADGVSRVVASFLTGAILSLPMPTKLRAPETVTPEEFLGRAGAAPGGPTPGGPGGAGFGTSRGKAWRDEIDEFLRQRAAREGGAAPGASPFEGGNPDLSGAGSARGNRPERPNVTPEEVIDILRKRGWTDEDIQKMAPEYAMKEVQDHLDSQPKPGTRGAPVQPEDLGKATGTINPNPTPGQRTALNYQSIHSELPELGLTGRNGITIETTAGGKRQGPMQGPSPERVAQIEANIKQLQEIRRARSNASQPFDDINKQIDQLTAQVSQKAPAWTSPEMPAAYGRSKQIMGADSTPSKPQGLDFFIGPSTKSRKVYVIDQMTKDGKFDEHKVMARFDGPTEAIQAYLGSYSDDARSRIGGVTMLTPEQFKEWTKSGKVKKAALSETGKQRSAQVKQQAAGDDLYKKAVDLVTKDGKASTSYIQRKLQLKYNDAATLIERMEREGIVSKADHAGKRTILKGGPTTGGAEVGGEAAGPTAQPTGGPTVPAESKETPKGIEGLTEWAKGQTGQIENGIPVSEEGTIDFKSAGAVRKREGTGGSTGGPRAPAATEESPAQDFTEFAEKQPGGAPTQEELHGETRAEGPQETGDILDQALGAAFGEEQPSAGSHEKIEAALKSVLPPHIYADVKDFDALIDGAAKLMEKHGWDEEKAIGAIMATYAEEIGLTTKEEIGQINGEDAEAAVRQVEADSHVQTELPSGHGVQAEEAGAPAGGPAAENGERRISGGSEIGREEGREAGEPNKGAGSTKARDQSEADQSGRPAPERAESVQEHEPVRGEAEATEGAAEAKGPLTPGSLLPRDLEQSLIDFIRLGREKSLFKKGKKGEPEVPLQFMREFAGTLETVASGESPENRAKVLENARLLRAEADRREGKVSEETEPEVDHEAELRQAAGEIGFPYDKIPEDVLARARLYMDQGVKDAAEALLYAQDGADETNIEPGAKARAGEEAAPVGQPEQQRGTGLGTGEGTGPRTPQKRGKRPERGEQPVTEQPGTGGGETTGPVQHGGPDEQPGGAGSGQFKFGVGDLVKVKSGVVYKILDVRDMARYGDKEQHYTGVSQRNGKNYGPHRKLLERNLLAYGVETTKPETETPKPKKGKGKETGGTGGPKTPEKSTITDTGEVIEGARKHKWKGTGLTDDQIEKMSETEKGKNVTKENVWPRPDYGAMIELGVEPRAAYAVKLWYDGLPKTPHTSAQREGYINLVRAIRDIAANVRTFSDTSHVAQYALNEKISGTKNSEWEKLTPVLAKRKSRWGGDRYKYEHPLALTRKDMKKIDDEIALGWPNIEPWKRTYRVEKIVDGDRVAWTVKHVDNWLPLQTDGTFDLFVRDKDGNRVRDAEGKLTRKDDMTWAFDTAEKAEAKAKELYTGKNEEGESTGGPKEPKRPILDKIQRVGPDRRKGRTVTAEDFANKDGKSHFDFRGLQWGDWVRGGGETKRVAERQDLLDVGFDAFSDLADLLGFTPRALSLQGPFRLGVAFGARGHGGKVAATYEPSEAVVNMTKTKGAGSLAHEWMHGFDHFVGELEQSNAYEHHPPRSLSGWYKWKGINKGTYDWSTYSAKRMFPNLSPRLAKAAMDVMQAIYYQREEPAVALKRIDDKIKDAEQKLARWKEIADESRKKLASGGDQKFWGKRLRDAERAIPAWETSLNHIKYGTAERMLAETNYSKEAVKLAGKGDYWKRPTEMLVRAFEAYVFDRLAEKGIVSPYLVQGVEENRYAGAGWKGNPYPTGRERRFINEQFDKLFKAIEIKDDKITGVAGEPVVEKQDWSVRRNYGTPKLSESFATHFRAQGFKNIVEAREFAKEEGFTDLNEKQIEEELELGIVKRAREVVNEERYRGDEKTLAKRTFDALLELYNRQPRLTTRTSTSVREQAYSTPVPLAFIASHLAGVSEKTTVFEPTAGNGALLIDARPSKTTANEINADRAAALKDQGFVPTTKDASTPEAYPKDEQFDVVLANPPFGAVKDEAGVSRRLSLADIQKGYTTPNVDHYIALHALGTMQDNGRAVLIVGGINKLVKSEEARSQAYQGKALREFYKALYDRYNVTDHFTVGGDLYARQGAAWPVDVLVIDGRVKSAKALPAVATPRILTSWDQLKGLLDVPKPAVRARPERPYQPGEGPTGGDEGGEGPTGGDLGEFGGGPRQPKRVRGGGGTESGPESTGEETGTGGSEEVGQPGQPVGEPGVEGGPRAPQPVKLATEGLLDNALDEAFGKPTSDVFATNLMKIVARIPQGIERLGDTVPIASAWREWEKTFGKMPLDEFKQKLVAAWDAGQIGLATINIMPGQHPVESRANSAQSQLFEKHAGRNAIDLSYRPTGEVAKAAAEAGLKGIDELTSAITKLMGGDPNKASMPGGSFDKDTYEKDVRPHLIAAARNFKEFKDNIQELVNRLIKHLKDIAKWTREMFDALRPYLIKFIDDVRNKVIDLFPKVAEEDTRPAKPGQATKDMETEHQAVYRPQSDIQGLTTLAPRNMIRPMAEALESLAEKVGPVDDYVTKELGYTDKDEMTKAIGAEQVDALAGAVHQLSQGAGYIIGDQTGIGKGRVNAGIIRWALKNDIVPVFVTAKRGLFADMYRDLSAIGIQDFLGGREPKILETNSDSRLPLDDADKVILPASDAKEKATLFAKIQEGDIAENFRADYDALFTNYSQLTTVMGRQTARHAFIEALAPHSVFIMDESHLAGGEPKRLSQAQEKKGIPQNLGGYMRELVMKAGHGVFFSSATYAKRPNSMIVYAPVTNMRYAVEDPKELAKAIERGRVPMQEVTATMLAQDGQYIRRERSFKGINFYTDTTEVAGTDYPNISASFQHINDFSKYVAKIVKNIQHIKLEGNAIVPDWAVGDNSLMHTGFTSVLHNIVGNMLLAMKADATVAKIKEVHAKGQKPLIMLAKTMESFLVDYVNAANELAETEADMLKAGVPVKATFNDILHRYLERSRIVLLKPPFQEEDEATGKKPKPIRYRLSDEDLGPGGMELFAKAKGFIDSFSLAALPIDPITYIRQKSEAAGIKMGEITGRDTVLDYSKEGVPTLSKRSGGEITARGKIVTARRFNAGELDGVIFNRSGSTGISLHSSETFKDQKPRHTIIVDPEPDINEFMQGLGRANRTGQVNLPMYTLMVTDLPAETRPTSLLMKKMASLNANTTGARGGNIALDVPDFFNEYGDQIATQFLEDNPDIAAALDMAYYDEHGNLAVQDPVRKMFGRMMLTAPDVQTSILDYVSNEYNTYIESLNAAGENALEAQKLDLKARPLERTEVQPATQGVDSVFASPVHIVKAKVKRLGKPYSSKEVVTKILEANGMTAVDGSVESIDPNRPAGALYNKWRNLGIRHDQQKKTALSEHDDYMRQALEEVDQGKLEKEQTRMRAQRQRWEDVHEMVRPGMAVRLQTNAGNLTTVVVGAERKANPVNPLALGSWKATFLAADANQKTVTIPFSRLYRGRTSMDDRIDAKLEEDPNSVGIVTINDMNLDEVLKMFDVQQGDSFEERYIATGNMLAAYAWLKNKGMIVHYTDYQGDIQQGILTAKAWDLGKHAQDQGIIAKTADELTNFINRNYNTYDPKKGAVWDADKVVGISRFWGGYYVYTVTAKRTGGFYYTNTDLTKLTGDFIKRGAKMEAVLDNKDMGKVNAAIQKIIDLGAQFKLPSKPLTTENIDTGPESAVDQEEAMFAGMRARSRDTYNLERAEDFLSRRVDPGITWSVTGWYRSADDGRMWFEIDDSRMNLKAPGTSLEEWNARVRKAREDERNPYIEWDGKLGELIHHPELFEAYPELKDYHVSFDVGPTFGAGGRIDEGVITAAGHTWQNAVRELSRQVQRLVNAIEGETVPVSPDVIIRKNLIALDQLNKGIETLRIAGDEPGMVAAMEEARDLIQDATARMDRGIFNLPANQAVREPLEGFASEARGIDTAERLLMDEKQRRDLLPETGIRKRFLSYDEPVGSTFTGEGRARRIIQDVLDLHELPDEHRRQRWFGGVNEILSRMSQYGIPHEIEVAENHVRHDERQLADFVERGSEQKYIDSVRERLRESLAVLDVYQALENAGFEHPLEHPQTVPIRNLLRNLDPYMKAKLPGEPAFRGSADWKRWRDEQLSAWREYQVRRERRRVAVAKLEAFLTENPPEILQRDPSFTNSLAERAFDDKRRLLNDIEEYQVPMQLANELVKTFDATQAPAELDMSRAQYLPEREPDEEAMAARPPREPTGFQMLNSAREEAEQVGIGKMIEADSKKKGLYTYEGRLLHFVNAGNFEKPVLRGTPKEFLESEYLWSMADRMVREGAAKNMQRAYSHLANFVFSKIGSTRRITPGEALEEMGRQHAQVMMRKITGERDAEAMASRVPEVNQLFDALEKSRNPDLQLPGGGRLYVRRAQRPDLGGKVLDLANLHSTEGIGRSVLDNVRLFSMIDELEAEAARRGYAAITVELNYNDKIAKLFGRRGYKNDREEFAQEIADAMGVSIDKVAKLFDQAPTLVKRLTPSETPRARPVRAAKQAEMSSIERELEGEIKRMLGNEVRVAFPESIDVTDSMREAYGGKFTDEAASSYVRGDQLIKIIAAHRQAREGVYHEAIHAFEDIFATDAEKALFNREMPRLRKMWEHVFKRSAEGVSDREVRANLGGIYLDNRASGEGVFGTQKPHVGLRAFWERIKRTLDRLAAWWRDKMGNATFEDVIDRLYEGRARERTPRADRPGRREEAMAARNKELADFVAEMKAKYGAELPMGFNKLTETEKLRYELMAAKVRDAGIQPAMSQWKKDALAIREQVDSETDRGYLDVPSMEPTMIAQDMRKQRLAKLEKTIKGDPFKNRDYLELVTDIEEVETHLDSVRDFEKQMSEKYGDDWAQTMSPEDRSTWAWVNHEAISSIEDYIKLTDMQDEARKSLGEGISNDPMFRNLDNPTELDRFKKEWGDEEAMQSRYTDNEVNDAIDWIAKMNMTEAARNNPMAVKERRADLMQHFGYTDPQEYVELAKRYGMPDPRVKKFERPKPPEMYTDMEEGEQPRERGTFSPETIDQIKRLVDRTKNMTVDQILADDRVWAVAGIAASDAGVPFEQAFQTVVNSLFARHGLGQYMTPEMVARTIRVQKARTNMGIGVAEPGKQMTGMPGGEGRKLAQMFLERFGGDVDKAWSELAASLQRAQSKGLVELTSTFEKAYNYVTSLKEKGVTGGADKVVSFRKRPRPDEEAMAARRPPVSPDEQSIIDRLGTGDAGRRDYSFDRIYYEAMDDVHPINVVERALRDGTIAPDALNSPYKLSRLTRGNWGRAEQFLQYNTYDFNTLQNNGPGLKAILAPVEANIERFQAYAVAKRAVELAERGIRTGMPIERARRVVADNAGEFETHFRNLVGYQDRLLDFLQASGIMSAESRDKIADLNKDYVPFYRILGNDTDLGMNLSPGAGLKVRNPVYAIRGSGHRVVQPIESIVRNTFLFVALAERNRALLTLKDLSLRSPEGRDFLRRSTRPRRPITVTPDEINRFLDEEGIDEEVAEALTIFRPNVFRPDNTHIRMFNNGRQEIYEVDPLVAESVNALDRQALPLMWRLIGLPAKWLRAGVILNPEYFARNVARDQLSAHINTDNNYRMMYDFARGFGALWGKGETFQNWLKSGGANATLVALDRNYINNNVVRYQDLPGYQKAWNVVTKPIDWLRMFTEVMENSSRIGEFIRDQEKNPTHSLFESGYASREVTLDFARQGANMFFRVWNHITPFFNAGIQGINRLIRQFRKAPFQTLFKIMMGITLPSILLWYFNKDDPRWREIPAYQRDFFWVWITDKWVPMANQKEAADWPKYLKRQKADGTWEINQGNVWRIPKPFEPGILFGSSIERVLDALFTDKPDAFRELPNSIMQGLAPNYLPQFSVPILEHITNHSFFLNRPLIPDRLNKVDAAYQSQPYTSETAKKVGGAIDKLSKLIGGPDGNTSFASPIILENYLREWTGGLGMHVLELLDVGIKGTRAAAGGKYNETVPPEWTWSDFPVIKGFHARFPGADAESVRRFYDVYGERERTRQTARQLQRQGNNEGAEQIRNERETVLATGIHRVMGNQFRAIREAYENKNLTPAEKRQLIDRIYFQMIETAKAGLEVMGKK